MIRKNVLFVIQILYCHYFWIYKILKYSKNICNWIAFDHLNHPQLFIVKKIMTILFQPLTEMNLNSKYIFLSIVIVHLLFTKNLLFIIIIVIWFHNHSFLWQDNRFPRQIANCMSGWKIERKMRWDEMKWKKNEGSQWWLS